MTLLNKTPQARKEALAYCRRCLAVMVCCVLVFGLTVRVTPRAKAVVVADDIAILGLSGLASVASSFGQHPVEGSLGQYIITGSGVKIKSGTVLDDLSGKTYFDAKAQELGVDLVTYLVSQGGEAAQWIGDTVASYQAKGGLAPGDSFSMPAAVVAATRQWAQTVLNFSDDGVTYFNNRLMLGPSGPFLLTLVDSAQLDAYLGSKAKRFYLPLSSLGSCAGFPAIDYSGPYSSAVSLTHDLALLVVYNPDVDRVVIRSNCYMGSVRTDGSSEPLFSYPLSNDSFGNAAAKFRAVLFYSSAQQRVYFGILSGDTAIDVVSTNYFDLAEDQAPAAVATTMTKTDALDDTPAAPITVTVPADLPVVQVGDYTAPMAAELTPDVVTGAQDPATPTAAPGTGITAQDIAGAIGQAVPGAVADGIAQALPDAIAQALPITGAIATDQAVNEVAQDPESLGSVFISKFPFSIPWDVGKVISLLAAQPVTPHWEVDFYAPLEGVGGFHAQGSTNFVIDFENLSLVGQLCRWTSTLGFIYSLMLATKRLIWTA